MSLMDFMTFDGSTVEVYGVIGKMFLIAVRFGIIKHCTDLQNFRWCILPRS
jgi:hypothetical protein